MSAKRFEEVASIDPDLVLNVIGPELSMGKAIGLGGIVAMVRAAARRRLAASK